MIIQFPTDIKHKLNNMCRTLDSKYEDFKKAEEHVDNLSIDLEKAQIAYNAEILEYNKKFNVEPCYLDYCTKIKFELNEKGSIEVKLDIEDIE